MYDETPNGQHTLALFLAGWVLFNYPLLALFSRDSTIFGVPLLYAYIFSAWLLLIGVAALITARLR